MKNETNYVFDEIAADQWNDGALDGCRGRPKASAELAYLEGYAYGLDTRKVRVVMPPRPEGYYHTPLDA